MVYEENSLNKVVNLRDEYIAEPEKRELTL